jgi:hypothetical protein
MDFKEDILYLLDLGYTSYDLFSLPVGGKAHLLLRMKENANPKVVRIREGVRVPARSLGRRLKDLEFCKTQDRFDLDAAFEARALHRKVTLRVVGLWNPKSQRYHCYLTNMPPATWSVEELASLYRQRWVIELLIKLTKSACHLDQLDTSNADAVRTQIYASLLAAVVLQSLRCTAAQAAGLPAEEIRFLTVGVAAPLLAIPLVLLWLGRPMTRAALAETIIRTLAFGCRDQNRRRTHESTELLR